MMSPSNSECPRLTLLRLAGQEEEHDPDNCFCCSEVEVAWTAPEGSYPEFINFKYNSEMVEVIVREPSTVFDGVAICGQTCRPGNDLCNGYCEGKAERARDVHYKCEGKMTKIAIPAVEFYKMVKRWL